MLRYISRPAIIHLQQEPLHTIAERLLNIQTETGTLQQPSPTTHQTPSSPSPESGSTSMNSSSTIVELPSGPMVSRKGADRSLSG